LTVPAKRIHLKDLAAQLGLELEGDADVELDGVAALADAGPGDLSFIRSASFAAQLAESRAGALIALPSLDVGGRPTLRSDDPSRDFYRAARILVPEDEAEPGIDPTARVAADAEIHPSASVGFHCSVGRGAVIGARTVLRAGVVLYDGVQIGEDCLLHAHCVVAAASVLGDRVILQPGVVIGGAGFGYVDGGEDGLRRIHDVGRVVVEDDVEIGANSTVDRGSLSDTRIGRGTKIDNLVMIGHNCQIGERVIIAAMVGLSGSTTLEDGCVLFGQVGTPGHTTIGAGAVVLGQSGPVHDVPPKARMWGTPAREGRDFHKQSAALVHLPKLLKRVRALERKLGGSEDGA
jgi:UDP-3-O-[3-hydroxymyristoyl] glucosamine N-acyltransferase